MKKQEAQMNNIEMSDGLGTCCSGMDALKCFEKLRQMVPEEMMDPKLAMMCDRSYNRLRYEVAKGYGVKKKLNKAVKAWHKDFYTCGHCGASAGEAANEYCPKCGTRYLANGYTEKLLEDDNFDTENILEEYEAAGS